MRAARLLSIAFILVVASLNQPRSAGAQIVPDWPTGGSAARPAEPVETTVQVPESPGIAAAATAALRRVQSASSHRWFVRFARKPVGYAPSWVRLRRPAAL
jgi:hypothetical protein